MPDKIMLSPNKLNVYLLANFLVFRMPQGHKQAAYHPAYNKGRKEFTCEDGAW